MPSCVSYVVNAVPYIVILSQAKNPYILLFCIRFCL